MRFALNAAVRAPNVLAMSDRPEGLVLVLLRRLDQRMGERRADIGEIRARLGIIEAQYSSLSRRLDRVGGDVALIKRRLDLVEG